MIPILNKIGVHAALYGNHDFGMYCINIYLCPNPIFTCIQDFGLFQNICINKWLLKFVMVNSSLETILRYFARTDRLNLKIPFVMVII